MSMSVVRGATFGGRFQLLAAALLFSTGGLAIKSCGLSAWQVASFRSGVAAMTLLLVLPAARRAWRWRMLPVGGVYAGTMLCYVLANKATTSANAIFLQAAAPLYLLILAPVLLGEKIRRRDVALGLAMAGGLVLLFSSSGTATATAPDPVAGNFYGGLAGLFWALTVLGLRWLASSADRKEGEAVRAVVAGNGLVFLFALPFALPLAPAALGDGAVATVALADWIWILYLGVFQIGLAYILLTRAVETVPAFEASILLLAEPVFTPLWTWWLLGELPSSGTWAGGLVILLATTAKTFIDFRAERASESP